MNKDRHGICDGCDRQKKLTLIHGRGLCVNCEILWGEAQKAIKDKYLNTNPEDLFFKWRKKEYPHKADIKYDSYAMEAFEAGWRALWDNEHD